MRKFEPSDLPQPVEPGSCVICGGTTKTRFRNQQTRELEYVHNYHEQGYFGCKEVWRYRQEKDRKPNRDELEDAALHGDDAAWCALMENENDPDYFLDEKDFYNGYRSYIQSREWQINAQAAKRLAHYKCENCGIKPENPSDLHVHHRLYRNLYHEQRQEVQILCATCHRKAHQD